MEWDQTRLAALSDWLTGRDYLEDRFTVALSLADHPAYETADR